MKKITKKRELGILYALLILLTLCFINSCNTSSNDQAKIQELEIKIQELEKSSSEYRDAEASQFNGNDSERFAASLQRYKNINGSNANSKEYDTVQINALADSMNKHIKRVRAKGISTNPSENTPGVPSTKYNFKD